MNELQSLADALVIINDARVKVWPTSHAAREFLCRVTQRLQKRQEAVFAELFETQEVAG